MQEKKRNLRAVAALAIVAVVYCAVIWLLPFARGAAFWVSFCFTVAAMAVLACGLYLAFGKGADVRSRFYGIPIARLSVVYFALQTALSLLFMALDEHAPVWVCAVIYILLLGAAGVGLIATDAARNEITRQDVQTARNVAAMRALAAKASGLPALAQSEPARRAAEKLAEDLRFSDPVSSPALAAIEAELAARVDALARALSAGNEAEALRAAQQAQITLGERNRLCKLGKTNCSPRQSLPSRGRAAHRRRDG